MMLKYLFVFFGIALIGGYLQCGSSDTTGGGDDEGGEGGGRAATSSGAAVGAVFGGLGGEGNLSEPEAKIPRIILNYLIQTAIAQTEDVDACSTVAEGGGFEGVTMEDDGTDDTYGNPAASMTVAAGTDTSFCADGGDVAAWSIASAVSVTCSDAGESFTASLSGSGVFRMEVDESMDVTTLIRGNFAITSGDDTINTGCSFDLQPDGTFAGEGCEGTDAFSTGTTCESPGDSGEGEGEGDDGGSGEDDGESFAGSWTFSGGDCGGSMTVTFTETAEDTYSAAGGTIVVTGENTCAFTPSSGSCPTCSYTGTGSTGTVITSGCTCGTTTFTKN